MTDPYPVTRHIVFEGWQVPPAFPSDRCTDAPDHWNHHDLRPACALHDFQRRYGLVPVDDADRRLKRFLMYLGAPHWLAQLYYIGVKLMRPWFMKTEPFPDYYKGFDKPNPDLPNMPVPS